jgi:hypothetical protein
VFVGCVEVSGPVAVGLGEVVGVPVGSEVEEAVGVAVEEIAVPAI